MWTSQNSLNANFVELRKAEVQLRINHQRAEKLLRALLCPRFGGRVRRFRSVLDLFSGSLGEPTGPTTTFSTGRHLLGNSVSRVF
jgi:hypothetical protein